MKCINTKHGEYSSYGGLCNIIIKDDDKRTMSEILTSLDPIIDIIDIYCDIREALNEIK